MFLNLEAREVVLAKVNFQGTLSLLEEVQPEVDPVPLFLRHLVSLIFLIFHKIFVLITIEAILLENKNCRPTWGFGFMFKNEYFNVNAFQLVNSYF